MATNARSEEQAAKKDFFSSIFKDSPAYLFGYFTGNGEDGLHLMYSYDGLFWQPLNGGKSLLKPEVGKAKLMRDPSIVRDKNGTFHLVWTTGWTENNIGYASSKDLINWSEQQEIPVMAHEPEVRNTWAPELFYDKNTFYIVWASTIPGRFQQTGVSEDEYNHRLYYTTTKDFKQFSPTSLFYDPRFNVIDPFILKDKGRFYLFMKNETLNPVEKNIRMTSSRKLTSFPKEVSEPISGKEWAEGPTPIRIRDYVYLYWDNTAINNLGRRVAKFEKTSLGIYFG
jgi:beta-galactosidase